MSDHSISKLKGAARKLIKIDNRRRHLQAFWRSDKKKNTKELEEIKREWEETMAELEAASQ